MKFAPGSIVRHRNGSAYEIVFGPDVVKLESSAAPAYAYRAADDIDKTIWVREQGNMESEGRFSPVREGTASP